MPKEVWKSSVWEHGFLEGSCQESGWPWVLSWFMQRPLLQAWCSGHCCTWGDPELKKEQWLWRQKKNQDETKWGVDISQKREDWIDGTIFQKGRIACLWVGKADAHKLCLDQEEDPGMQMPQRSLGKIYVKWLLDYGYFPVFSMLIPKHPRVARKRILAMMLREMLFIDPMLLWEKTL